MNFSLGLVEVSALGNAIIMLDDMLKVADVEIGLFDLGRITAAAAAAGWLGLRLFSGLGLPCGIPATILIYLALLCGARAISAGDVTWFKGIVKADGSRT